MSNEIDWSKAPEGATHYGDRSGGYVECWYRIADGELEYKWADTFDAEWKSGALRSIKTLTARPCIEWTGTGLPPVGTVCEFYSEEDEEWLEGEIIAHGVDEGRKWAIMQCDDAVWMGEDHEFRVKRTSEQIAAEDRERAIKEIASMIGRGTFSEDAARIYDAGYRKTEAGK